MPDRIKQSDQLAIVELLLTGDMSYDDLADQSGLSKDRVARFMRRARKMVHVSSYGPDKNGRLFVRRFAWGAGSDAPRPGRVLTAAEQMRKLRARRKAKAEAEQ